MMSTDFLLLLLLLSAPRDARALKELLALADLPQSTVDAVNLLVELWHAPSPRQPSEGAEGKHTNQAEQNTGGMDCGSSAERPDGKEQDNSSAAKTKDAARKTTATALPFENIANEKILEGIRLYREGQET